MCRQELRLCGTPKATSRAGHFLDLLEVDLHTRGYICSPQHPRITHRRMASVSNSSQHLRNASSRSTEQALCASRHASSMAGTASAALNCRCRIQACSALEHRQERQHGAVEHTTPECGATLSGPLRKCRTTLPLPVAPRYACPYGRLPAIAISVRL